MLLKTIPSDRPAFIPVETYMKPGFSAGKAIVALNRAITSTFDEVRWQELGYLLDKHETISDHPRLLRSLYFKDDDYGSNAFNVIKDLLGSNFENLAAMEEFVGLREWLHTNDPTLCAQLYDNEEEETNHIPLTQIEDASDVHDIIELNRHASRIRNSIQSDPEQAIGSAKELLESVLKTVIGDHSQKSEDNIHDLLRKARKKLELDPKLIDESAPGAETLKRTLGSLGQIVTGVAELRNLYGTGHGRSKSSQIEIAHARLVVNAAISIATFMMEVWQEQ